MSSLACLAASYLLNSIWEVPLIGAAAWVMSRLVKKLGPQAQHATWVAALSLAILTPALSLCGWPHSFNHLSGTIRSHISIHVIADQSADRSINGIMARAILIEILAYSYLATLVYFAARFAWSLYWTTVLFRSSVSVALSTETNELWNRCKHAFCVENALLQSSRRVIGPGR